MAMVCIRPLSNGPIALPQHGAQCVQRPARMQVKTAASSACNFPHHRARITHSGAIIPQPWSPSQHTPLAQHSPTLAEPIQHTSNLSQPVLQLALDAVRAVVTDRALQQKLKQAMQRLEQQLGLALAAAQAWAQAAWLYAVTMWPVWVGTAHATLAHARSAVKEAAQGRGPVAQLPAVVQRLGEAWGLQRLSKDIMQQLPQLAQLASLQSLAAATNSAARRTPPQQPYRSAHTSSNSSGMDDNEPMKQSAALALAAASITTAGVQPLSDFAFIFGRWGGKQQPAGSSNVRMPWHEQQQQQQQEEAEPNTDEVWAEMMGLPDGADWDSTWQGPGDTAQLQQGQQQQQQAAVLQDVAAGQVDAAAPTASRTALTQAGQAFAAVGSAGNHVAAQTQLLLAPSFQQAGMLAQAHRGPAIAVGLTVALAAVVSILRRWSKRQKEAVEDEVVRQVSLQLKAEELAAQRARFKRVLVASEPDRESRKTALLMQQQEEQDWESSAAAAASATASATGSAATAAAAASVQERAGARDDAAMREWQRFVQRSRMGEVEQLWDARMVDDEPQASAELLSRMTQQIRDAGKGDEDAESAKQAAQAAEREAERQELDRLRQRQQAQQRQQQQQQEDAAGGLDAGMVQRARERRARAAALALQQLQEAEQQREGSVRVVAAANPFALSSEERAKWEAEEHIYNDPKASQRGKATASQIISSGSAGSNDNNSNSAHEAVADSSTGRRGSTGSGSSQGSSSAAGRSGRSSPSGLEPRQATRAHLNPAGSRAAPQTESPVAPAGSDAKGHLDLTEEQRQEWGDWHEELGGIRGSGASRRRRQQQQASSDSNSSSNATSAAAALPHPPALVPAQLETPSRPLAALPQQRRTQQPNAGMPMWQQVLALMDVAGRNAARSISASISAGMPSSRSNSNSGASRLRASASQQAPPDRTATARALPSEAAAAAAVNVNDTGVWGAGETEEQASLRHMREVAQELAEEVVGASSLARGVAVRDMDRVAAPAPVLPASQHYRSTPAATAGAAHAEEAARAEEAGRQEEKQHNVEASAGVEKTIAQEQRRVKAVRVDVNPFAMPMVDVADEEDEGEEREAELARMQVVLPPLRAAFAQQRGL